MGTTLLAWAVLILGELTDDALAPWANNHHPSDVARRHVQDITGGRVGYLVVQRGTMDGRNCRSPQGVWQPFEQTWESNRIVRMENVGTTDVVNPWLSNGRDDLRSIDRIVSSAGPPSMSAGDKARAIWWQQVQRRFHFEGDNDDLLDPVKVLNVYGFNTCGNDSICLAGLWRKAGFKVAPARLVGHCVTQVFYDGAWHLMDGDMHSIYLLRDNETIAGEQDLVRDHDLIRRTHTQGILQPDTRSGDEWESSIYVFEGSVSGDRASADTTLNMTLRPGEAIVWRWGHRNPIKYHAPRPPQFPDRICNGLWEYRPDFTQTAWRAGASTVQAIRQEDGALMAEDGKTGVVVWTMSSPYVFVGGMLDLEGTGVKFELSWDGNSWQKIDRDLDRVFAPEGRARYRYYLKCELSGDARLRKLAIKSDVQMAPLALPEMGVGTNEFTYSDGSAGGRSVRITHEWVERSASRPPAAPAEPGFPSDGRRTEGTAITFQWRAAADPDGDAIADYHFELSSRADMKWPLSMSFAKLISRTRDAGAARYTVPAPGLLNPDTTYFWHVRAKDEKGVWGPWSPTWSFSPRGPFPPENVRLEFDRDSARGVLRWTPGSKGRKPVAYRVYGSDEKGFSISDRPYEVTVGSSETLSPQFPLNLVGETSACALEVVGPHVSLPGANKAFYRVVAVDEAGIRSGPSDYTASPRPVIVSVPLTRVGKGANYRYGLAAIRSLGDLRTRVIKGKETMNFWDVERIRFEIERGPRWLAIDHATGVLSGRAPDQPGTAEVVVSAALERDVRRLDAEALKWGIEKVVSTGAETVGVATQTFRIDVGP